MKLKLWAPVEIFKKRLNLTKTDTDQEVRKYALQAQEYIERACNRKFDATESSTEYHDGGFDFVALRNWPIQEITEFREDVDREWAADTEIAVGDRFVDEANHVYLRSGLFADGSRTIKAVYRGGYYPTIAALIQATIDDTDPMDTDDDLLTYADNFTLYVITRDTDKAGTIELSGLDSEGDALTEIVTPTPVDSAAGDWTILIAENLFSKLNTVDASDMVTTTEGTVEVYASSVPRDLILCAEMIAGHFYLQDQKGRQGIGQQSYGESSESQIVNDFPKEALEIIKRYRSFS